MKRYIQILLLCLVCATAMAQSTTTHRLRVTTMPDKLFIVTLQVYPTAELYGSNSFTGNSILAVRSDTTNIDVQVPEGAGVQLLVRFQGYNAGNDNFNPGNMDNYTPESWTANGTTTEVRQVSSEKFLWVMPDHDVDLVGTFAYNPANPGEGEQPAMGGWEPETGTLINDAQNDYYEPLGFTNADRANVLRYIRSGSYWASNRSLSFRGYNYPNCTLFDASRTNATRVSSSYDNAEQCSLTDVVLPATLTTISSGDFRYAKLQTITIFATTPPRIQSSYLTDNPDAVVRVPADAVPIYKSTDRWKDYTIVAIDEDYANLTVQLMQTPDSATIARYKNMYLDLTNIESGTTRSMLVNSRNAYEFRYLPTNTAYNAVLRTATGSEIARIGNIYLGKEHKSVTFSELKMPRRLALTLLGSDSQPIDEALYTTTWMKADGTYLKRGNTIDNVLDGQQLRIMAKIGPELAMQYAQPDTVSYTVGQDADYHLQLLLPVQPVTTVTFTAVDSLTHRPISGVTVDVSQVLFNGDLGTRSLLTTGNDGKATGEVLATMSTITMTSAQHGSQTFTANLADSTTFRKAFIEARGTQLMLGHTWQASVKEDETPVVEPIYSDGRSLEYTFTATLPDGRDSVMVDYLTRYPQYTFYNTLPQGTKVRVKAVSTKDDIEPVEVTGTVTGTGILGITLPIVERGSLHLSYTRSESVHPAALLFNATTGELVRKQAFGDRTYVDFVHLPAGDYLVAAMSKGPQYLTINSRTQLEMYTKDKDYTAAQLTIAEGRTVESVFANVPITKTQLETNLSERRATGSADGKVGYYSTISVKVAFKDLKERTYGSKYDESKYPTNCQLEVYMPEGFDKPSATRSSRDYKCYTRGSHNHDRFLLSYCTIDEIGTTFDTDLYYFLMGEITMRTATSQWNEQERKLTIPWPHYDEGGKMNIVAMATKAGSFMPEMYLTYTLDGKQYREALETTSLLVSRSAIKVNETVVSPYFTVVGTAMYSEPEEAAAAARASASASYGAVITHSESPYYEVTVMDGDTPIGSALVKKDGKWSTTCRLVNPTTGSSHNIYAVIKPSKYSNFSYQTESKTVTYDPNAVVPYSTTMTYFNHLPSHLDETKVVFDYLHMKATPESYAFSFETDYKTDFTFEVNLSNNDTTKVYAVALHIWTDGPEGGETIAWAHYNKRKNRWIAYEKFNINALPSSVYVEPYYYADVVGSRVEMNKGYSYYNSLEADNDDELDNLMARTRTMIAQAQAAVNSGKDFDFSELISLQKQIATRMGVNYGEVDASTVDIDQVLAETEKWQQNTSDFLLEEWKKQLTKALNELGELTEGISFGNAQGLTAESLLLQGYMAIDLDDGSKAYVFAGETGDVVIVDFTNDVKITIRAEKLNSLFAAAPRKASAIDTLLSLAGELKSLADQIATYLDYIGAMAGIVAEDAELTLETLRPAQELAHSSSKDTFKCFQLTLRVVAAEDALAAAKWISKQLDKIAAAGYIFSLINFAKDAIEYAGMIGKAMELKLSIDHYFKMNTDCSAEDLIQRASDLASESGGTVAKLMATSIFSLTVSTWSLAAAAGVTTAPPALLVFTATATSTVASLYSSHVFMKEYKWEYSFVERMFELLKRKCQKKRDCKLRGDCPKCTSNCGGGGGPYDPSTTPLKDPSGFVYEGVASNRLEGVTTTVFYKETTKDLFGDDVEKVVMWDAERYNQVNPQTTDENGEYGWMVPSGWWQVKYEKDGYQTEYSEWLPVPPPQLDVNQAMMSAAQPMVSDVKATPQAVVVTFDKYMLADSITAERLFVTRNGQKVSGNIVPVLTDDVSQSLQRLANKVRFEPASTLPAGQKLTLTVKGDVQSYAGVEMGSDFSQEFDIKAAVERIVADSTINVNYDQGYALNFYAQPAAAAAGKKVVIRMLGDMVASITSPFASELTLDAQGKGSIIITGEAHGTTGLLLQMADDPSVKKIVLVNVKDESDFVCPLPTSNYQPSQAYPAGTQIELTCELPEATIYYTLDGSCPCSEENDVHKYEAPITLNGDMVIKAFATAPGYADSDIAELTFLLYDPSGIYVFATDSPARSNTTYTLSGLKVAKTKHLSKGLYIRNGKKVWVK